MLIQNHTLNAMMKNTLKTTTKLLEMMPLIVLSNLLTDWFDRIGFEGKVVNPKYGGSGNDTQPNHQKRSAILTLNLYTGKGLFLYFVYDNGNPKYYADHSVYCYRLNNMSLDQWVDEGNNFFRNGSFGFVHWRRCNDTRSIALPKVPTMKNYRRSIQGRTFNTASRTIKDVEYAKSVNFRISTIELPLDVGDSVLQRRNNKCHFQSKQLWT